MVSTHGVFIADGSGDWASDIDSVKKTIKKEKRMGSKINTDDAMLQGTVYFVSGIDDVPNWE